LVERLLIAKQVEGCAATTIKFYRENLERFHTSFSFWSNVLPVHLWKIFNQGVLTNGTICAIISATWHLKWNEWDSQKIDLQWKVLRTTA
jgi:hypothetical protein